MSVYNTLITSADCPHCGYRSEVHADFRFGLRDQIDYHLGDRLMWDGNGVRTPLVRPPNGDFSGEAYTECPVCDRDFWLVIHVESDIIVRAATG